MTTKLGVFPKDARSCIGSILEIGYIIQVGNSYLFTSEGKFSPNYGIA